MSKLTDSDLYKLTKDFNTISGSINETDVKHFREQLSYIQEEVKEIEDGINSDSFTEVLDGCIDTIITVFGMLQKLESYGIKIDEPCIDTALNNLSKYPIEPAVAYETVERKRLEGVNCTAYFNEKFNRYVIRNNDTGKIIKPYNFISNNLSKYITESE